MHASSSKKQINREDNLENEPSESFLSPPDIDENDAYFNYLSSPDTSPNAPLEDIDSDGSKEDEELLVRKRQFRPTLAPASLPSNTSFSVSTPSNSQKRSQDMHTTLESV